MLTSSTAASCAAKLLYRKLKDGSAITQAIAKPPMIVNIMAHDTSREPLRLAPRGRLCPGIPAGDSLASPLPGFAYADVPQMGPSVVVATAGDAELVATEADRLAQDLWNVRDRLIARLPDAAAAVAQALKAELLARRAG